MKKIALLIVLLASVSLANAETKDTNKKWLAAVQKMVGEGQKQVTTPNQERVDLLKDWARKEGYSVVVTKKDFGYQIEVGKFLAKK